LAGSAFVRLVSTLGSGGLSCNALASLQWLFACLGGFFAVVSAVRSCSLKRSKQEHVGRPTFFASIYTVAGSNSHLFVLLLSVLT
jgi:hypothetical protein